MYKKSINSELDWEHRIYPIWNGKSYCLTTIQCQDIHMKSIPNNLSSFHDVCDFIWRSYE